MHPAVKEFSCVIGGHLNNRQIVEPAPLIHNQTRDASTRMLALLPPSFPDPSLSILFGLLACVSLMRYCVRWSADLQPEVRWPVIWPGGQLELNAREFTGDSNDGGLRVEVLAEDLSPIAGLTLAEADLVSGDGRLTATWRGDGKALEPMKDRTIRLKIYLERMDLFSLRASRESAPEAGGILEGGLPPATSAGRGGRP